jgi:hypothetical protein
MRACRLVSRVLRWTAVALCACAVSGPARAGDPDVARSLLQSGKEAFAKKRYDEAITLLGKAREEAPALAEAAYWIGAARERTGDGPGAIAAYREFRAAFSGAEALRPSKTDADLLSKAKARLASLAPAEAEDDRLRQGFAADLISMARGSKDPAVASLALEALLRAEPDDAGARELHGRTTALPARKGEVQLARPFLRVRTWRDLILEQTFGRLSNWKYEPPGLVIDTKDRQFTMAPIPIRLGAAYALDMEVRLLTVHDAEWRIGFGLHTGRDRLLGIVFTGRRLWAFLGPTVGMVKTVSDADLPAVEPGAWRRLSVLVEKNRVEVWYDPKRSPLRFAESELLEGMVLGVYHTGCRAEVRTLRWAPLE